MNILSIETSTHVGSVALHIDGELMAYHENHQQKSHSEYLAVAIDNMIKECNIRRDAIDVVAVAKGPGSYTGLRIGVSLAKGICFGTGAKLVSVGTLEVMTFQLQTLLPFRDKTLLCPMIDARRMEVYCQLFDRKLNAINEIEAKIIDGHSFSEFLEEFEIYFFGNGASKCKEIIKSDNAVFLEDVYPSARYIGDIALDKIKIGKTENVAYFEPYYLKEFIAKKPSGKNLV